MKVYISADIEGVTGTTHWDETTKDKADYAEFRDQMTAEVAAACEGTLSAGAAEVWVKDAHDSGRNIVAAKLPRPVRLARGWSGHPLAMAQALNESFDAMLMIGYHARAGSDGSPLAHTMTGEAARVRINDRDASEFLIHAYAAAWAGVPVAFVSGDASLCAEAQSLNPHIATVAVKQGVGNMTVSIHPHLAVEQIRDGVRAALEGDLTACLVPLPDHFAIEIRYRAHAKAYPASFYPGARLTDSHTVAFEADDYFEVLRFFLFVL
ncbi:MAG: M55 family metallopeptidase [Chloroflexi bacterium]|nr:M55 family metallopeptidase [Chloroflexota bacterium]MBU1751504.1 M55 family metallopeptidase [Chloroflexota bacterium]